MTMVKQKEQKKNPKEKQEIEKKSKREFVTYKYSQMGKGELCESIMHFHFFIKYSNITKQIEQVENISENTRILRPPEIEEYPYTPYEFSSLEEINRYKDKIIDDNIDIDYLFQQSKSIISKFNN